MYFQTLPFWKLLNKLLSKPENEGESNFWRDAYGLSAAEDFYNEHKGKVKPLEPRKVKMANTMEGAMTAEKYKPTAVLNRIEENTRPLREIASQILGGGALAKNALNRQDLSDLRTGRSGGSQLNKAMDALVGAIQSEMVMRGAAGTRREI